MKKIISDIIYHLVIADTVWDENLSDHHQTGSVGERIKKTLTTGGFIALK